MCGIDIDGAELRTDLVDYSMGDFIVIVVVVVPFFLAVGTELGVEAHPQPHLVNSCGLGTHRHQHQQKDAVDKSPKSSGCQFCHDDGTHALRHNARAVPSDTYFPASPSR